MFDWLADVRQGYPIGARWSACCRVGALGRCATCAVKHIVHDWEDDEVLQILCNVRTAMTADAKLLITEAETPDNDREHVSKLLDLEMLVAGTGKERMEAQYAELLRRAASASRAPFDGGAYLGRRARSGLTELIPRRYAVGLDDPRRI